MPADPAFSDEAFDGARLRWEAPHEIAKLKDELAELRREYDEESRAIQREMAEWEEILHPAELQAAFDAQGDYSHRVYWKLRHAGLSTFEEAAAKTDAELLAIDGIGSVSLGLIRNVLAEYAG